MDGKSWFWSLKFSETRYYNQDLTSQSQLANERHAFPLVRFDSNGAKIDKTNFMFYSVRL